jgi:hypothetical protein
MALSRLLRLCTKRKSPGIGVKGFNAPMPSPIGSTHLAKLADKFHPAPAIRDCKTAAPDGVNSHKNTLHFKKTVSQNAKRNDSFFDLWRSVCWAMSAPGHPPASDKK